jgi:oxygen-independent coproporphyrinogen III oxidase
MAGIYIHIPFCKQACHYCDFHFSTSLKNKADIVAAIVKEIHQKKDFFDDTDIVESVYFGGGTPSLLAVSDFEIIIDALFKNFKIPKKIEFTVEANPDDIIFEKLVSLKNLGVNRLSIGVQSFNDNDLKTMNRSHNAAHAINCLAIATNAGIANLSIDLMYGLPNQTVQKWYKNLLIAQQLNIQHISCYCLTVEEKTVLHKLLKEKKIEATDENTAAEHFTTLMQWAKENDFEHYEISNFAKPEFRAVHNTNYWLNKNYIGIGPSAHSYINSVRQNNISNNSLYIKHLNQSTTYYNTENLSQTQLLNEYLLTNLRTIWGLNTLEVEQRFGRANTEKLSKKLIPFIEQKLVVQIENTYSLTNEGKFFADHISAELFF